MQSTSITNSYWDVYVQLHPIYKALYDPNRSKRPTGEQLVPIHAQLATLAAGLSVELHPDPEMFQVNLLVIQDVLRNKYGWFVFSPQMLEAIPGNAPIIEIGAGTGYTAHLLRQSGTEVLAFDNCLVGEGKNDYLERGERISKAWTEVLFGNEAMVKEYPYHRPLLVYPPLNDKMALKTLSYTKADIFIYAGEDELCGCRAFHKKLEQEWTLVNEIHESHWAWMHDSLKVYQRKS